MTNPFGDNLDHWFWAAMFVLFALIEGFTLGLTAVWFAIGAFILVFLSFLDISFPVQSLIFLGIASLLLFFTRPIAVKNFKASRYKKNMENLAGKHVLVVKTIYEFENGLIKVNDQILSARADDNIEIPEGSECEIVKFDSVILVVRRLEK